MGYLDNSSRTLDAILTKKGREILSSGGDFNVTKFALGDDEVDYALWDTTHTQGTEFYGAVIDNLPALEPFNDPSEIMKYKLVTRSYGCEAMAKIRDEGGTTSALADVNWHNSAGTGNSNRVSILPAAPNDYVGDWPKGELGGGSGANTGFNIGHVPNFQEGNKDFNTLSSETYTITLLDSSIALLAPEYDEEAGGTGGPPVKTISAQGTPSSGFSGTDIFWMPFVDNVQHISQTMSGIIKSGNKLTIPNDGRELLLYSKKVSADSTTSVIVTGDLSGAVLEFPVTVDYNA